MRGFDLLSDEIPPVKRPMQTEMYPRVPHCGSVFDTVHTVGTKRDKIAPGCAVRWAWKRASCAEATKATWASRWT